MVQPYDSPYGSPHGSPYDPPYGSPTLFAHKALSSSCTDLAGAILAMTWRRDFGAEVPWRSGVQAARTRDPAWCGSGPHKKGDHGLQGNKPYAKRCPPEPTRKTKARARTTTRDKPWKTTTKPNLHYPRPSAPFPTFTSPFPARSAELGPIFVV